MAKLITFLALLVSSGLALPQQLKSSITITETLPKSTVTTTTTVTQKEVTTITDTQQQAEPGTTLQGGAYDFPDAFETVVDGQTLTMMPPDSVSKISRNPDRPLISIPTPDPEPTLETKQTTTSSPSSLTTTLTTTVVVVTTLTTTVVAATSDDPNRSISNNPLTTIVIDGPGTEGNTSPTPLTTMVLSREFPDSTASFVETTSVTSSSMLRIGTWDLPDAFESVVDGKTLTLMPASAAPEFTQQQPQEAPAQETEVVTTETVIVATSQVTVSFSQPIVEVPAQETVTALTTVIPPQQAAWDQAQDLGDRVPVLEPTKAVLDVTWVTEGPHVAVIPGKKPNTQEIYYEDEAEAVKWLDAHGLDPKDFGLGAQGHQNNPKAGSAGQSVVSVDITWVTEGPPRLPVGYSLHGRAAATSDVADPQAARFSSWESAVSGMAEGLASLKTKVEPTDATFQPADPPETPLVEPFTPLQTNHAAGLRRMPPTTLKTKVSKVRYVQARSTPLRMGDLELPDAFESVVDGKTLTLMPISSLPKVSAVPQGAPPVVEGAPPAGFTVTEFTTTGTEVAVLTVTEGVEEAPPIATPQPPLVEPDSDESEDAPQEPHRNPHPQLTDLDRPILDHYPYGFCSGIMFYDQTSDASPDVMDCLHIAYNIRNDGRWEIDLFFARHRQIVQYGGCAVGIQGHNNIFVDTTAYVGYEDVIEIIYGSVELFGHTGKVGAKGYMDCTSKFGGSRRLFWGLY